MKIGKYHIRALETGYFWLDGGAMFGVVPKTLWQMRVPPDEKNRVRLSARSLYIEGDGKKIIVDAGLGEKWSDKLRKIYKIEEAQTLEDSLTAIGVATEDVTDVVLTHLHFDHSGGLTKRDENGDLAPAFPNARHHVHRRQYEWALAPSVRDQASYLPENYEPVADLWNFLDDDDPRLDDEISFEVSEGHTFGQLLPKISDGSRTLFHTGDMIPTAANLPLPYVLGFDLNALATLREKETYLPRAVEEDWLLFFQHDPKASFAKPARSSKGFEVDRQAEEPF
jgi:glyoxylase-like metal-dependent hydrolase (beta-lactamase superfamily II)